MSINDDVDEKIVTAVERVIHCSTKLELDRLKFLFKDLGKLDYVIAREELAEEGVGISPREGNTTIEMLIDDCRGENVDKIEIEMYIDILWRLYEEFRRGHRR